jgi:hypothetical protein
LVKPASTHTSQGPSATTAAPQLAATATRRQAAPTLAEVYLGQCGPALPGMLGQPLLQGCLGRVRDARHGLHRCRSWIGSACRRGLWVRVSDNLIMSRCAAVPIAVSSIERQVLTARARRASGEQRDVLRARIVLAAAGGQSNAAIARKLGITGDY